MSKDKATGLDYDEIYSSLCGMRYTTEDISDKWDFGEMTHDQIEKWIEKNCSLEVCSGCGYWVDQEQMDNEGMCEGCTDGDD